MQLATSLAYANMVRLYAKLLIQRDSYKEGSFSSPASAARSRLSQTYRNGPTFQMLTLLPDQLERRSPRHSRAARWRGSFSRRFGGCATTVLLRVHLRTLPVHKKLKEGLRIARLAVDYRVRGMYRASFRPPLCVALSKTTGTSGLSPSSDWENPAHRISCGLALEIAVAGLIPGP